MDKIWYENLFEVGGHWPLWRGWKKWMTTQNRQKSNAKKQNKQNIKNFPFNFKVLFSTHVNTCIILYRIIIINEKYLTSLKSLFTKHIQETTSLFMLNTTIWKYKTEQLTFTSVSLVDNVKQNS